MLDFISEFLIEHVEKKQQEWRRKGVTRMKKSVWKILLLLWLVNHLYTWHEMTFTQNHMARLMVKRWFLARKKCLFNSRSYFCRFRKKQRRQERCQVTERQNDDNGMKTWHEIWMNTFERQCFEWAMYNYTCVMSRFRINMNV